MTTNLALQSYVTRVAFNLTLTGQMIASLDQVELDEALWSSVDERIALDKAGVTVRIPTSAVAYRGLLARGLVQHHERGKYWVRDPSWTLTEAGRLVCALLVEAGMKTALKDRLKDAKRALKAA